MLFWDFFLIAIMGLWVYFIFITHQKGNIFKISGIKFGLLVGFLGITAFIHVRCKGYFEIFSLVAPFIWNQIEKNVDRQEKLQLERTEAPSHDHFHANHLDLRKVVVAIVRISDYGNEIVMALRDAQEKMSNLRIEICQMKKSEDIDEQITLVHDIINKKPDALLLMPIKSDPRLIEALIEAKKNLNILVVTLDRQLPKDEFYHAQTEPPLHFSSDFYLGGQKAAETMIQCLGKRGNIAYIDGEENSEVASTRRHAFVDVILKHSPQFRIVYYASTNWSEEDGKRVMKKFLEGNIKINGVFCCNDTLASGALSAIAENPDSHPIVVIGYDGIHSAMEKVDRGEMTATVNVKLEHQVNHALLAIESILYNKKVQAMRTDIPIPPTIHKHPDFHHEKKEKH